MDDTITSDTLLGQADAVFQKRDYKKALEMYCRTADAAYEEFNRSIEIEGLAQVARCHLALGQKDQGREYLLRAEKKASESDPWAWSRYLSVKGRYEWKDDNLVDARKTFEDMYAYCQVNELWGRAVDAANMLAIVSDDPNEQIAWSRKGIQAAQSGEVDHWLGPLWNNLGATYYDMNQYETALTCFEQAREYHWRFSDEQAKLFADYHIGMTLRRLGRFDDAATWLRPVLAWAERLGHKGAIAQAAEDLGETVLALGDKESARAFLIEAREALLSTNGEKSNLEIVEQITQRIDSIT